MFIISLVGRKGGTGKTTLALGLAVAAARAGHAAVILDIDPQTSAARWKEQRSADNPAVISASPGRAQGALIDDGLFVGQSAEFLKLWQHLAADADAAQRGF